MRFNTNKIEKIKTKTKTSKLKTRVKKKREEKKKKKKLSLIILSGIWFATIVIFNSLKRCPTCSTQNCFICFILFFSKIFFVKAKAPPFSPPPWKEQIRSWEDWMPRFYVRLVTDHRLPVETAFPFLLFF